MEKEHVLQLSDKVYWVGVLDHGLRTFDVVMETQFGTTYNSYLILAEKKAVVETVKENFWPEFENKLRSLIDPAELEYIILNHTEPDHSGCVGKLLEIAPQAKIVGTGNAIRYLKDLMPIAFVSIQVKDGDELDLGNMKLQFLGAANLHWPDTMYTYLEKERILFSCDSFSAHYADERMFDDLVDNWDDSFTYYFDVILKPFSKFMLKAIERIRPLQIDTIATGHGPILRSNWKKYVDLSERYATAAMQLPKKLRVYIPYVSAYHKTGALAEAIAQGLQSEPSIEVVVQDIEHVSLGDIEMELALAAAIIVGSPTINQNILLPIYRLFAAINPLRDRGKPAGGFGSYGWSGEAARMIRTNLENLKLKYTENDVFVKFSPHEEDLLEAEKYGRDFARLMIESQ